MTPRVSESDAAEARRTAALAGLAVILALAIVGILLVRALRHENLLVQCLMQGRSNCMPIELPLPEQGGP